MIATATAAFTSPFDAYRLGGLTLSNRIVMAPMTRSRVYGEGQTATDLHEPVERAAAVGLSVPPRAARVAGVSRHAGREWFKQVGGVNPYPPGSVSGRYLSLAEREEVAVGLAAGRSQAQIARALGRHPSTISREVGRNSPAPGQHLPRPILGMLARIH